MGGGRSQSILHRHVQNEREWCPKCVPSLAGPANAGEKSEKLVKAVRAVRIVRYGPCSGCRGR
jgi:hypothetical protein